MMLLSLRSYPCVVDAAAATVSVAVLVLVLFVALLDDADAALVFALVTPAFVLLLKWYVGVARTI